MIYDYRLQIVDLIKIIIYNKSVHRNVAIFIQKLHSIV